MSQAVVGLPTSRACRRLLELIVEIAEAEHIVLTPPVITTIGQIPEYLYRRLHPVASDLMQRLAWTTALAKLGRDELRLIGCPVSDQVNWSDLFYTSRVIAELHRELAGNMYSFRDALEIASENPQFRDHERWEVLHRLQMSYFQIMRELGVWDIQTARRLAVEKQECGTEYAICILGSVDLNRTMQRMLDQVGSRVTLLVVCDSTTRQGFDDWGCLVPDFWESLAIPITDDQLRVGVRPHDQAQIVVDFLGRLNGKFSASQISVAAPDDELIPFLARTIDAAGVMIHDSTGETISAAAPVRLLSLAARYLEYERYVDFANLLRHETVFARLSEGLQETDWLARLERDVSRLCPMKIELAFSKGSSHLERIANQLAKLFGDSASLRSRKCLTEWSLVWRDVLQRCFTGEVVDRENPQAKHVARSMSYLNDALAEMEALPETIDAKCSAIESLQVVLEHLRDRQVFSDRPINTIELMGWLDLIWDDAPVAVVTSFNERTIPQSRNFHPFLPNGLRNRLGLIDNRLRFVLDKFRLFMLGRSRAQLLLVAGRRDVQNNPLLPSRLLFNRDAAANARRLLKIIHHAESPLHHVDQASLPRQQQFVIPSLTPLKELKQISVTDFDVYLTCPYRFYLARILRLESFEDQVEQMDHAIIGTLAHRVLEAFGNSDLKDSTDPRHIRKFLQEELKTRFQREFSHETLPIVEIQLANLEMRLDMFSEQQANRRKAGWIIEENEKPDLDKQFDVDGDPVLIKGRIDRIDRNETSNRLAIIDFKTSIRHSTKTQIDKHGVWRSLQLPLYHWLVQGSELDCNQGIEVGFGRLGQNLDEIEFDLIELSTTELNDALEQAREIIRAIRKSQFEPNPNMPYQDVYQGICQDRVFERWMPTTSGETP